MTPPVAQGIDMKANGRDIVKGMTTFPPQVQTIEALSPQTQTNTPVTGMNTGGNTAQGGMSTTTNNNTLSDPNKNKAAVPPVTQLQMPKQNTSLMAKTPVEYNGAVKKTAEELVDGLLIKRAACGKSHTSKGKKRNKYVKSYKKSIKKAASDFPESPENAMCRFDEALEVMVKEAAETYGSGYLDPEELKTNPLTDKFQKQVVPTQNSVQAMDNRTILMNKSLMDMDKNLASVKDDSADIRKRVEELLGATKNIGVAAANPDVVESAIPGPVAGAMAGGGIGLLATRLLKKSPSLTNYLTGAGIGTGLGVIASFATKKYAKNLATNINDSMTVAAAKDKK